MWGQIEVFGFEVKVNPFLVGVEVRLNDPDTGPLVGRGFGSSSGAVTIVPHTSTPNNPNVAITPENEYALVQAGSTSKIYVNLYNDGMAAVYDFDPTNAQVSMLAVPIGTEKATPIQYFGTLHVTARFTGQWELA